MNAEPTLIEDASLFQIDDVSQLQQEGAIVFSLAKAIDAADETLCAKLLVLELASSRTAEGPKYGNQPFGELGEANATVEKLYRLEVEDAEKILTSLLALIDAGNFGDLWFELAASAKPGSLFVEIVERELAGGGSLHTSADRIMEVYPTFRKSLSDDVISAFLTDVAGHADAIQEMPASISKVELLEDIEKFGSKGFEGLLSNENTKLQQFSSNDWEEIFSVGGCEKDILRLRLISENHPLKMPGLAIRQGLSANIKKAFLKPSLFASMEPYYDLIFSRMSEAAQSEFVEQVLLDIVSQKVSASAWKSFVDTTPAIASALPLATKSRDVLKNLLKVLLQEDLESLQAVVASRDGDMREISGDLDEAELVLWQEDLAGRYRGLSDEDDKLRIVKVGAVFGMLETDFVVQTDDKEGEKH